MCLSLLVLRCWVMRQLLALCWMRSLLRHHPPCTPQPPPLLLWLNHLCLAQHPCTFCPPSSTIAMEGLGASMWVEREGQDHYTTALVRVVKTVVAASLTPSWGLRWMWLLQGPVPSYPQTPSVLHSKTLPPNTHRQRTSLLGMPHWGTPPALQMTSIPQAKHHHLAPPPVRRHHTAVPGSWKPHQWSRNRLECRAAVT